MPRFIVFLTLTIGIYIGLSFHTDIPELSGRWEWVETTGGVVGVHKTPKSEGYHEEVVFNKDGKFQLYRNQQVIDAGTFKVSKAETILGEGILLKYGNRDIDDIVLIRDSELTLINNVIDGFRRSYRKNQ